jgi:hypothetical protein
MNNNNNNQAQPQVSRCGVFLESNMVSKKVITKKDIFTNTDNELLEVVWEKNNDILKEYYTYPDMKFWESWLEMNLFN